MANAKARKLTVQAVNTSGDDIEYSFAYNPAYPLESDQTAASNLSTLMGAVNGLTTNTYRDTAVIDTFSLNELAAN